ncbi:MAG: hypothetical protein NXI30_04635 [bacterium]|nr:hypothetical protein [bacterium]
MAFALLAALALPGCGVDREPTIHEVLRACEASCSDGWRYDLVNAACECAPSPREATPQ